MKKKRKKNIDRTKYGDYTNSLMNNGEVFVHTFIYGIISFVLFLYSLFSVYKGVFYIPGKRGRGIHLTGVSMILMVFTVFLLIVSFFVPILGYYLAKKSYHNKNEIAKKVKIVEKIFNYLSWAGFILALITSLIYST